MSDERIPNREAAAFRKGRAPDSRPKTGKQSRVAGGSVCPDIFKPLGGDFPLSNGREVRQ